MLGLVSTPLLTWDNGQAAAPIRIDKNKKVLSSQGNVFMNPSSQGSGDIVEEQEERVRARL